MFIKYSYYLSVIWVKNARRDTLARRYFSQVETFLFINFFTITYCYPWSLKLCSYYHIFVYFFFYFNSYPYLLYLIGFVFLKNNSLVFYNLYFLRFLLFLIKLLSLTLTLHWYFFLFINYSFTLVEICHSCQTDPSCKSVFFKKCLGAKLTRPILPSLILL